VRALGLVLVIAESLTGRPAPAAEGRGLVIALALSVAALCWALCVFAELLDRRVLTLALGGLAAGGGLLASLQHHGVSLVFGCLAGFMAGYLLELTAALGVTAVACLGTSCGQLAVGGSTAKLAVSLLLYCWFFFAGLVRDEYSARARQAEQLLAQTARLSVEESRVAALAERARIAREIHDVLAHSMASLSVQLQAASALLDGDGLPKHPDLATASTCVRRASSLAREGLIETRRAIHALREDHEDAVQLPALLATLAEDYQDADGAAATLAVTGNVKTLPAQAGLALLRTAQEALTNVRKHAPDAPVSMTLEYQDTETRLTVTNPASHAAAPLADTGAGFGLTGLRERAELAGGQLSAGPLDGGWQLTARIPS
jgi:signal transduction histidine kinase